MNTLGGWPAVMRIGAVLGLVGILAPSLASAEIYAWVDANGEVTYGNLPPPKNARVFEVINETPPPSPQSQAAAEAAHRAEMQALNNRLQQLEQELQRSRYQAAAPAPYPMAAPPAYYPPPEYASAPSYGGCDSDFYDCSSWDGPIYYTVGVAPTWGFRHRDHDFDHFHHDFDHFHHGHLGHPTGGPHFVGATHFSTAHFASSGGHMSGGHMSSHGSGGHSR
jgi:hypothetical protein